MDRQMYVCMAFGQLVLFMQWCGLVQGDLLSLLAWLLVYDTMLTVTNRWFVMHMLEDGIRQADGQVGGLCISAVVMADDLLLMVHSQRGLQEAADFMAGWFAMVGVRVNPTKTEHISYSSWAGPDEPALTWIDAIGDWTEITQWPATSVPVHILGQRLIADRMVEQMVTNTQEFAEEMVDSLS
ncbi:hypothetical protein LPJ61_002849 [Coemansia biformis]|uniref:Reverse transcriptase domain-containing protein n=1 Tax=Coemansia biformis TaxID=1286918 RepID=A0A9W8CWT6_9FUNG|nr:hypothetical protein LPJ61_002849 [Coemansia biformis]